MKMEPEASATNSSVGVVGEAKVAPTFWACVNGWMESLFTKESRLRDKELNSGQGASEVPEEPQSVKPEVSPWTWV